MKKFILFTCIAAFIIACGGEDASAGKLTRTAKKTAAKVIDGAKIYKLNCVICHGVKGDMGSNGAFNLQTSALNEDARVSVIKKGRGVMNAFEGILKEEEIRAVAQYTMTLTKK